MTKDPKPKHIVLWEMRNKHINIYYMLVLILDEIIHFYDQATYIPFCTLLISDTSLWK